MPGAWLRPFVWLTAKTGALFGARRETQRFEAFQREERASIGARRDLTVPTCSPLSRPLADWRASAIHAQSRAQNPRKRGVRAQELCQRRGITVLGNKTSLEIRLKHHTNIERRPGGGILAQLFLEGIQVVSRILDFLAEAPCSRSTRLSDRLEGQGHSRYKSCRSACRTSERLRWLRQCREYRLPIYRRVPADWDTRTSW